MKKVLGIILFTAFLFVFTGCAKDQTAGTVTLQLYNASGVLLEEESVDYLAEDTLLSITLDTFGVTCQGANEENDSTCSFETEWGHYVLGVGSVMADSASNQFVSIEVNGILSEYGIDDTLLVDGNTYAFKIDTWS